MSEWRLGRRHYGYRVYEGDRPVATFHDAEDAVLAVRLHNDHVRAEVEARDRKHADCCDVDDDGRSTA